MAGIYERNKNTFTKPHRHSEFTLYLIKEASGQHLIDYYSYELEPLQLHFVSPGQVHQLQIDAPPQGWAMTFSDDFLVKTNIPQSFITNFNLFKSFGETPPLKLATKNFERLTKVIDQMNIFLPMDFHYRDRALGALLQLFLIYTTNCETVDQKQFDEENPAICLFRDFKKLVDNKFSLWHKVSTYADEIHISAKHLSQTVKSLSGKSAKELIQDRILLEAKRLLLHTQLSVKEVAYKTGFEEPLHFSSFFKTKAGISPSHFRESK